jgi:hypothetical protein
VWVFLATLIIALPFILLYSLGLSADMPSWVMADPQSAAIHALTLPMIVAYVFIKIEHWRRGARRTEVNVK